MVRDLHDQSRKARPVPVGPQTEKVPGAGLAAGVAAVCGAKRLFIGKDGIDHPAGLPALKATDSERTFKMAIAQQISGIAALNGDRVLHGVGRVIQPVFRGGGSCVDLTGNRQADNGCRQCRKAAKGKKYTLFHHGLLSLCRCLFLGVRLLPADSLSRKFLLCLL